MSRTVDRYVLGEILTPVIATLAVLAAVLWLTQSLQLIDLVLNRGQSAGLLLRLTVLGLPTLLAVIAPFAFLVGALFALHRLTNEGETTVILCSCAGRAGFAAPIAAATALLIAFLALLNFWAAPAGSRTLKREILAIRADLAASLIRPGAFTNPTEGVTVYARSVDADGLMRDLMLYDARDTDRETTYLARTAALERRDERLFLAMKDGAVQRREGDAPASILVFDSYAFDATQMQGEQDRRSPEAGQRFLSELLFPDEKEFYDRRNRDTLIAAGHARLAALWHVAAFGAIAFAAARKGATSRRTGGLVILVALAAGFAVRIIGYPLETLGAQAPATNALQHLWPLAACAAGVILGHGAAPGRGGRIGERPPASPTAAAKPA